MHNSSESRKRTPKKYLQGSRLIENKIFISSQYISPLSTNISNKLDLIKQEISRQLNQRLPVGRKKKQSIFTEKDPKSFKKEHSSLRKERSTCKNSTGSVVPIQTRLNFDQTAYREKYYQAHQSFLNQKQKNIQFQHKINEFKRLVYSFIQQPNLSIGQKLVKAMQQKREYVKQMQNLQQKKVFGQGCQRDQSYYLAEKVSKICALAQKNQSYEGTLIQIMNIMQVEDLQTLMEQITGKWKNWNSINQCTYKILQLETSNNKICHQYDKKIIQLKQYYQNQQKNYNKISEQQIQLLKLRINELEKSSHIQSTLTEKIKMDLRQLCQKWKKKQKISQIQMVSDVIQIRDLCQIVMQMQFELHKMKQQFEQNRQIISQNNNEVQRLQKVLETMVREGQEQDYCDQKIIQEKDRVIEQMRQKIDTIIGQITDKNDQLSKKDQKLRIMDRQMKERQCYLTALYNQLSIQNGVGTQMLILKIRELNQRVLRSEKFSSWQQKQLQTKQKILKQFNYNIDHFIQQNSQLKTQCQNIASQREEYKHLLINLRSQLSRLKQEHKQELQKLTKEKEADIVQSNKDILQFNASLTQQNQALRDQVNRLKNIYHQQQKQTHKLSIAIQQSQKTIRLKSAQTIKSHDELSKYKRHMQQIQTALRQVETIGQINSHKVESLQSQNQSIKIQLTLLRQQRLKLQLECQQKVVQNSRLLNQISHHKSKIKDQHQLQSRNSQLVLQSLSKDAKIRDLQQQIKIIVVKNQQYASQNRSMMKKVNTLLQNNIQLKDISKKNQSIYENLKYLTKIQIDKVLFKVRDTSNCVSTLKKDIFNQISQMLAKQEKIIIQAVFLELRAKNQTIRNLQSEIQLLNHPIQSKILQFQSKRALSFSKQIDEKIFDKKAMIQLQQIKERLQFQQNRKKESDLRFQRNNIEKQTVKISLHVKQKQQVRLTQFGVQTYQQEKLQESNDWNVYSFQQDKECVEQNRKIVKNKLQNLSNEIKELKERVPQLKQLLSERQFICQNIQQIRLAMISTQQNLRNKAKILSSCVFQIIILRKQLSEMKQEGINVKRQICVAINQFQELFEQLVTHNLSSFNNSNNLKEIQNKISYEKQDVLPKKSNRNQYLSPNKINEVIEQRQVQSDIPTPTLGKAKSQNSQNSVISNKMSQSVGDEQNAFFVEKNNNSQVERVLEILTKLKQNDGEYPDVPYFQQIKELYDNIKRTKPKKRNLALDLSEIQGKQSISSPSSMSFMKDFTLERRMNTDPPQDFKETNRSQRLHQSSQLNQLQKSHLQLKQQYERLDDQHQQLIQKYNILLNQKNEVERINTQLENQMSIKAIQNLFSKLIQSIVHQKIQQLEQSIRMILKLLNFPSKQIQHFNQQVNKKKKKKGGFFSAIFK